MCTFMMFSVENFEGTVALEIAVLLVGEVTQEISDKDIRQRKDK